MYRKFGVFFIIAVSFCYLGCDSLVRTSLTPQSDQSVKFAEGEVIVGMMKNKRHFLSQKFSKTNAIQAFKVKAATSLDAGNNYIHLKLEEGETVNEAIERIKTYKDVEFVQPNYIYHASSVPNDTHYGKLWSLKNTAQTITTINSAQDDIKTTNNPGVVGNDISAEAAWNVITDCSSVVVGVVDTGAKLDHEDLINNLWAGPETLTYNGYDAVDQDNFPWDLISGHGTHVATTIGAEGNNGKGSAGVCWKAKIMPVRVLDDQGVGTTARIIVGISYAVAYGAKIINMSLGGTGGPDLAYYGIIRDSEEVLFVVAAGNGGPDVVGDDNTITPTWPCNFSTGVSNIICVGAVDQSFSLASYSNYSSTAVQLSAPGTNILGGSPSAEVVTTETFTAGWNGDTGNWALGIGPASLINPTNYNGSSNQYANNLKSAAYKTFNFASATSVLLEFDVTHFLENNYDFLRLGVDRVSSGTDLFTVANQTPAFYEPINAITGIGVKLYRKSYDPYTPSTAIDISSTCAAQINCSIGFQLQSDFWTSSCGVQIINMKLSAVSIATNSYKIIAGTSMATPHVTGVAALVWAYNPLYTITEVKNALLNGGKLVPALSGKTSTSRVLNAMGSLAYISKPDTPIVTVR